MATASNTRMQRRPRMALLIVTSMPHAAPLMLGVRPTWPKSITSQGVENMKVFISWSGPLSQKLAAMLRVWLPSVIQVVKPYYSPDDINKGTRWAAEISKELEESQVGLLCITPDNLYSPWIMFEAGALSK